MKGYVDAAFMRRRCLNLVLVLTAVAAGAASCASRGERAESLYQRLQSGQDAQVAHAAVEAGATRDRQAVPYLIEALENDAADIRIFAIASLRQITGKDLGFRPWAAPGQRAAAVQRWRQWWAGDSATAFSAGE
jgi:hypothetical protein